MNANDITAIINDLDGFTARAWTKAPGKERVYVEFGPKNNGGKHWHGGVGYTAYLDVTSGEWRDESWAGAATRKFYGERIEAMKADIESR